jgi:ParB family chromosome partitioning protein
MRNQNKWVNTDSIEIDNDFEGLYSRKEKLVETIAKDIRENGYDEATPIICCERKEEDGHRILRVIDGHTRLAAAKKAGLQKVLVSVQDFPDKDIALLRAIYYQRERRNMSDADIYICAGRVDKLKRTGRKSNAEKLASGEANLGKSAERTAVIVGTSKTIIERVRYIRANADEQTKQDVRDGKKTINRAYNETRRKMKVAENDENKEKSNGGPEDNDLPKTFHVTLEKLLAVVKQAKADDWQKLDKQAVFYGLKELGKLLEE